MKASTDSTDPTQQEASSDKQEAHFTAQERAAAAAIWLCAVAGRDAVAQPQVADALLSPDMVIAQQSTSGSKSQCLRHVWAWESYVATLAGQGTQK
jgi:hypothetical protein